MNLSKRQEYQKNTSKSSVNIPTDEKEVTAKTQEADSPDTAEGKISLPKNSNQCTFCSQLRDACKEKKMPGSIMTQAFLLFPLISIVVPPIYTDILTRLCSEKHLEDETFRRDMYGRYAQP